MIVLGTVPAAKLLPGRNPIGQTVRVGSHEFEVVGIQARKGKLGGENLDNRVFVPLPVVLRVLLGGATSRGFDFVMDRCVLARSAVCCRPSAKT